MNWNLLLNECIDAILPYVSVIAQIIVCVVMVFVTRYVNSILKKNNIELDNNIMNNVKTLVIDVVKLINQTIVDSCKEMSAGGKLSEEDAATAYNEAYNRIMSALSEEEIFAIIRQYGSLSDGLQILIESAVSDCKKYVVS